MHYNIEKLISQYKKSTPLVCQLFVSDVEKLCDITIKTGKLGIYDILYNATVNGWAAGYSAGYNKAKREARKKG